jgi:hypothetical protein
MLEVEVVVDHQRTLLEDLEEVEPLDLPQLLAQQTQEVEVEQVMALEELVDQV